MAELHRTLKPNGFLSVSDHHTDEHVLAGVITGCGLFNFKNRNSNTFQFERVKTQG
jgi:hypothetical protein